MNDSLRDRIANTLYQELSIELPAAIRVADAVIEALASPMRGCTDQWHWSTGEPYRCPSCGYWMGEGYV